MEEDYIGDFGNVTYAQSVLTQEGLTFLPNPCNLDGPLRPTVGSVVI